MKCDWMLAMVEIVDVRQGHHVGIPIIVDHRVSRTDFSMIQELAIHAGKPGRRRQLAKVDRRLVPAFGHAV